MGWRISGRGGFAPGRIQFLVFLGNAVSVHVSFFFDTGDLINIQHINVPIDDLVFAPINAIKEADIELSNGILKQIATFSEREDGIEEIPVMKLKNIKFLYERAKSDQEVFFDTGDLINIQHINESGNPFRQRRRLGFDVKGPPSLPCKSAIRPLSSAWS